VHSEEPKGGHERGNDFRLPQSVDCAVLTLHLEIAYPTTSLSLVGRNGGTHSKNLEEIMDGIQVCIGFLRIESFRL